MPRLVGQDVGSTDADVRWYTFSIPLRERNTASEILFRALSSSSPERHAIHSIALLFLVTLSGCFPYGFTLSPGAEGRPDS
jgi:hypothetical protein